MTSCCDYWYPSLSLPGLIQFQSSLPAEGMIRPAAEPAPVTVNEEDGEVRLLVARAQGLLGKVMVGYRTSPFTAVSPEDYEVIPSLPYPVDQGLRQTQGWMVTGDLCILTQITLRNQCFIKRDLHMYF